MVTYQKFARFLLLTAALGQLGGFGCGDDSISNEGSPAPDAGSASPTDAPGATSDGSSPAMDAGPTSDAGPGFGDGASTEADANDGNDDAESGTYTDGATSDAAQMSDAPNSSDAFTSFDASSADGASAADASASMDGASAPEASVSVDAASADGSMQGDSSDIADASSVSDLGGPLPFHPVHFSDVDKSPSVALSADRLGMQQFTLGRQGVRSDVGIEAGSGVFYFEATRLADGALVELGVATASVPLDSALTDTNQTYGVDTGGSVIGGGTSVGAFDAPASSHYGFVVDYRQAHPFVTLMIVAGGAAQAAFRTELTQVSSALYLFAGGLRRKIGIQATINPGNDTTNFPFFYDARALMRAAGVPGADELVLGWGGTFAGGWNAPPSLHVSADQTVTLGSSVTVSANANDAEDGDLTSRIVWGDLATPLGARVSGTGGQFTLIPNALGVHLLEASVSDNGNKVVTASVRVTVSGTLPTVSPVQLEPDPQSGQGILLTNNGLSARFTASAKLGIRANQGLLHGFRYFEIHRDIPPMNMGGGLVIKNGNLNPYDASDVPPSCSVNVLGGTWQSLMFHANFPDGFVNEEYYGFAVDYRGSFPIVYVIVKGQLVDTIPLADVSVPIYPMLYGNPTVTPSGSAETINFGATAFHYDPAAVLSAAGVDVTGFIASWGP